MICHQYVIREELAAVDPRPAMSSLHNCTVMRIDKRRARPLILAYEWLGNMGRPLACYGLLDPNGALIGVVTFSHGPNAMRRLMLGPERENMVICLERGACVHWAHEHAATFMISRATRLARLEYGWELVYAYADPAAGEIGTIYQAGNWIYLGAGPGKTGRKKGVRHVLRPPGVAKGDFLKCVPTRRLRQSGPPFFGKGTYQKARELGYSIDRNRPVKHVYVLPVRNRSKWIAQLEERGWRAQPYPKRNGQAEPDY